MQTKVENPCVVEILGCGNFGKLTHGKMALWKETRTVLHAWLRLRDPEGDAALSHNRCGRMMTRSGFEYVLAQHVRSAAKTELHLAEKRVTPHVLRHSCAVHTLQVTGDGRRAQGLALARPRLV